MSDRGHAASTAVGRFADVLLADDLPALPADRRADTVALIERRIERLPSVTRFGVRVISFAIDAVTRIAGSDRALRLATGVGLPLLAEYPRLVRSLGYAHVWETWPATDVDGGPV
ncbi:MAG: hypothetical protein AAF945_07820 [Actinomycetota bacterium]